MKRDARPFVAHFLRTCADARMERNGAALHLLARWVENLPANDPSMALIAATDALDYGDGSFRCGSASRALVEAYRDTPHGREQWLAHFAETVESELPPQHT